MTKCSRGIVLVEECGRRAFSNEWQMLFDVKSSSTVAKNGPSALVSRSDERLQLHSPSERSALSR